jgi:hypothetical protein
MRIPIIRLAIVAALVVLTMESAAAAGDEGLSPALEKRMAAIEKKIEATQQTFDQILKGIDDMLWFERVGDGAHKSAWPQLFADQFGWEELVRNVNEVYQSLPPEDRARTFILAGNYGEAGAIDLFGPKYGLPPAICAHPNYYFWGTRGFESGTMIILQWDKSDLEQLFESVVEAKIRFHPYGMAEENNPIYLCRNPKFKLSEIWPKLKHWN